MTGKRIADVVLGPSEAVMRRLKLPQKFALIAVLLVTPFVFVAIRYINAQDSQKSFAVAEQVGLKAVNPMISLLVSVDAARSAAAHGGSIPVATVQTAEGQVDAVVAGAAGGLRLSSSWGPLKSSIDAAAGQTPAAGASAVRAWSAASGNLVNLIALAADRSNLTLDPVLDSYYLQDALTVKIPSLLDSSGLGADLAAVGVKRNRDAIALANGNTTAIIAGLTTDLQKAVASTKDARLGPATLGTLSSLNTSVGALADALTRATTSHVLPSPSLATAVRGDALALANATSPQLNGLLTSHVSDFNSNEQFVELVGALALALALWLFIGFFRSMTGGVSSLVGVLSAVESGDLSQTASTSGDEIGQMGVALNRMRERMNEIVERIARTSATLSSASEELSSVSREMSTSAEQTADQAGSVSAAAEQVSGSIQSASVGTEEMGASINEIAKQAADAARVATEAVSTAETTNSLVHRLGESSTEIDDVIKIISAIAKQTNLLALNASIEAARAGDAGKGFAVVAAEVKELARDTARSSEKIEQNIAAIQADTRDAVDAIGKITSTIHQINDIQTMIAAAVEEQAATTNEIARSVSEAAAGSGEITKSITGVADAAQNATRGAGDTHRSAEELARLAAELLALTRQFRLSTAEAPEAASHTHREAGTSTTNGSGTLPDADPELAGVITNAAR
jgi:methyl-accepting chemotaxis protein